MIRWNQGVCRAEKRHKGFWSLFRCLWMRNWTLKTYSRVMMNETKSEMWLAELCWVKHFSCYCSRPILTEKLLLYSPASIPAPLPTIYPSFSVSITPYTPLPHHLTTHHYPVPHTQGRPVSHSLKPPPPLLPLHITLLARMDLRLVIRMDMHEDVCILFNVIL